MPNLKESKAVVDAYRIKEKALSLPVLIDEIRELMGGRPGKPKDFSSEDRDTFMSINRRAFVAGGRLAYVSDGLAGPRKRGSVHRTMADVTTMSRASLVLAYGTAMSKVVPHVLNLEAHGVTVPKFVQPKLVFSNERKAKSKMVGSTNNVPLEDVTIDMIVGPISNVPEVPVTAPAGIAGLTGPLNLMDGSEFEKLTNAIKTFEEMGLLTSVVREELNNKILDKLFATDFVAEILKN